MISIEHVEKKDTMTAQQNAYIILKNLDKLINDLENLEEIHCKEHESSVIDDEVWTLVEVKKNLEIMFRNAVIGAADDLMEVDYSLMRKVEKK